MQGRSLGITTHFTVAACHIQIALSIVGTEQEDFLVGIVSPLILALSLILVRQRLYQYRILLIKSKVIGNYFLPYIFPIPFVGEMSLCIQQKIGSVGIRC